MSNWVKIVELNNLFEAESICQLLMNNDIETTKVNKTDSSYAQLFGKIEIYCHQQNIVQALHLISTNLTSK